MMPAIDLFQHAVELAAGAVVFAEAEDVRDLSAVSRKTPSSQDGAARLPK
jgi:hypothetical protein